MSGSQFVKRPSRTCHRVNAHDVTNNNDDNYYGFGKWQCFSICHSSVCARVCARVCVFNVFDF